MKHAFVIAGTHSNVGKTTVSTALMAALVRRGHRVQGFKVGPDFIDPGFHSAVTGRPSRNLDGWMLPRETNRKIFAHATTDTDVAVIEGVMGLFDGSSGRDEFGSTAEIAKWLGMPVVLLVDASGLARSVAALVHGFESFDPEVQLAAVITNRVGGTGHYRYLEDAIRSRCHAEPVGWLAESERVALPSRHLGLVTAPEVLDAAKAEALAEWAEATIDLDRLLELSTLNDATRERLSVDAHTPVSRSGEGAAQVRIGVARDRAFCFYYEDNLDLLRQCGAELVFWSPIDERLPRGCHGLYFGGGYPELYAPQLAANHASLGAVREFIDASGMVYAECGGLMYLTEAIVDRSGCEFAMAGILPTRARMRQRLAALGYIEVEVTGNLSWLERGLKVRGHQFRFSEIDPVPPSVPRCYSLRTAHHDERSSAEGFVVKNCLVSYVHLHFLSNPEFAARWVDACRRSIVTS